MNPKLKKLRRKLVNKYLDDEPWKDAGSYSEACENAYESGFDAATKHILKRADEILVEALNGQWDEYGSCAKAIEQWRKEFEGEG